MAVHVPLTGDDEAAVLGRVEVADAVIDEPQQGRAGRPLAGLEHPGMAQLRWRPEPPKPFGEPARLAAFLRVCAEIQPTATPLGPDPALIHELEVAHVPR